MKILIVSDVEDPYLWDYFEPGRLDGIDLILACGDLKASYLSFLVTVGKAPVYYVYGNHDGPYLKAPPEGCECIDDRIVTFKGLRILGLGGSPRYNGEPPLQYSESEMAKRIRRLRLRLLRSKGVDILLTHAAATGWGDGEGYAHRGFDCFNRFMDKYHPRYHVHGHVHMNYGPKIARIMERGDTRIINGCGKYILEIDD